MIGLDKGYAGLNGFNIQNACWFYLIILLQSGQEAGSEATDQFLSGRLESHSGIPVGQWTTHKRDLEMFTDICHKVSNQTHLHKTI